MSGLIFDIKKFAVHDGPGIRTTVFLKGCPLNCFWCHNPESISSEIVKVNKITRIGEREFDSFENIGKEVTAPEIIRILLEDKLFYEESSGGATFSGGEPLQQIDFLEELLQQAKAKNIHTAIDTSGFAPRKNFENILANTDLFLFDLKLIDDKLHKKYCGVSNEKILRNLQFIISAKVQVIIRIPLIPKITDTKDNINAIISFLKERNYNNQIHLLPYHNFDDGKYNKFRKSNLLKNIETQDENKLNEIKSQFANSGFDVQVGG